MNKKRVYIFAILFTLIFYACAKEKNQSLYPQLDKITKENCSITIIDPQRQISLVLNEEQKKDLLEKLKVSQKAEAKEKASNCKTYKLNISYKGEYLSFTTNGKTLCQCESSQSYKLLSDCTDTISSVFAIYDSFITPSIPKKADSNLILMTGGYFLQKKGKNKYYVLEVIYGSGLPVVAIRAFDLVAKNGFIHLYDDKKISVKDDQYELYSGGKKNTSFPVLSDYSVERLENDMHSFYMYHN